MIKVAHYPETYLTLTQTWLYGQMARLKKFEPIILCRNIENIEQFPIRNIFSYRESLPLPVRCYYAGRYFGNRYLQFYRSVMASQRAALLHAHFGNCGYDILPIGRAFSIPQITSFYGYDATRLVKSDPRWSDRYRTLFDEGRIFIAEGGHMAETLHEIGCPREKLRVLRLGVDLTRLPYKERQPADEVRILAAGRFREKKGHVHAIEAAALVARQRKNVTLTLIGDAARFSLKELKEKRRILAAIHRSGLDGRVRLLGYQPYAVFIRELYNHHIFISPSIHAPDGDSEGGAPVSVIEASASGMPILSTKHCDIPEVVLDGASGHLVPEGDVEALAERLLHLVDNADSWKAMGLRGRAHIEERHDLEKQVPKLEQLYQEVLDDARA